MSRKAPTNVTLLGAFGEWGAPYRPLTLPNGANSAGVSEFIPSVSRLLAVDHGYFSVRCRDSESSVDDLGTGRGVVLGRAVATLRSVETQP